MARRGCPCGGLTPPGDDPLDPARLTTELLATLRALDVGRVDLARERLSELLHRLRPPDAAGARTTSSDEGDDNETL